MKRLDNVPTHLSRTFTGTYRLTGRVVEFDNAKTPFLKLRLSDCLGDQIAMLNLSKTTVPERIGHLDFVTASGVKCLSGQFILDEFRRASRDEVTSMDTLQSLPRVYSPVPEVFDKLVATVQSLQSECLRAFLTRVLERKDRLEAFLNAPASVNYHHAYPGGLLEHSLNVANNAVAMLRLNEPAMSRLMQETCFVAGLLHDIGKTYTYDSKGKPNAAWKLCSHDAFTLEACAYGLAYLDKHASDLAIMLRHIWTCASPGARYGQKAAITLARYIRDADGQSAMADNQIRAFRTKSHWGFSRLGQNLFWRPEVSALQPQ
ncbi:TraI domain-containing protein [Halomonas sp. QX-2]|jgi:3'-5' exoribonuclease|uniref:TraI domain-containing protein n=1 Tax=Vreelandella sedimenti TaxID=2729618 RepID=A0A7Z0N7R0_9GAMM|nr:MULTISPECIES: TraI domain-containing protein [Halomonas]NYT72724.1 TraI domain-containing protein [Halomonas sedimenti]|tara:strand:+ start:40871 stop:41824 length:954 start_codon:yes stop_codon:yes gene_type:complete